MKKNNDNLIFSDTETTGVKPLDFIQIIQSASIFTDCNLNKISNIDISCKPLDWIVPTLSAYKVHKKIHTLKSNTNHYSMMKDIYDTWSKWTKDNPAVFITYNGHKFDEELYRRQFYWNLLNPFITNSGGNKRLDMLHMIRTISQVYPSLIDFEMNKNGYPVCKLESISQRIGVDTSSAHDALSDCEFMLKIYQFIKENCPNILEEFLYQSSKKGFIKYLEEHLIFFFRYQPFARYWNYPISFIGINPLNKNLAITIDLLYPQDDVFNMSYQEIIDCIQNPGSESPFKIFGINKTQSLVSYKNIEYSFDINETKLIHKAKIYRANLEWRTKVLSACIDIEEKKWPSKKYIEEKVYDGFFSEGDKKLFKKFHEVNFDSKLKLLEQFSDERAKEFAHRILWQINPNYLNQENKSIISKLIQERWFSQGPWISKQNVIDELRGDTDNSSELKIARHIKQHINNINIDIN